MQDSEHYLQQNWRLFVESVLKVIISQMMLIFSPVYHQCLFCLYEFFDFKLVFNFFI